MIEAFRSVMAIITALCFFAAVAAIFVSPIHAVTLALVAIAGKYLLINERSA